MNVIERIGNSVAVSFWCFWHCLRMLDQLKTMGWRSWSKLSAVSPTIRSPALSKAAERLGVITCFHPRFFGDASSWLGPAVGSSSPSVSWVPTSPITGDTFHSCHSSMLKIIGFIFQLSLPDLFLSQNAQKEQFEGSNKHFSNLIFLCIYKVHHNGYVFLEIILFSHFWINVCLIMCLTKHHSESDVWANFSPLSKHTEVKTHHRFEYHRNPVRPLNHH